MEPDAVHSNEVNDNKLPLENSEFQEENGVPQKANNDSLEEESESQEKVSPTVTEDKNINKNQFDNDDKKLIKYTEEQLPLIDTDILHMEISTLSEAANRKVNTEILEEYDKRVCIKIKSGFHILFIKYFINYRQSSIMIKRLK